MILSLNLYKKIENISIYNVYKFIMSLIPNSSNEYETAIKNRLIAASSLPVTSYSVNRAAYEMMINTHPAWTTPLPPAPTPAPAPAPASTPTPTPNVAQSHAHSQSQITASIVASLIAHNSSSTLRPPPPLKIAAAVAHTPSAVTSEHSHSAHSPLNSNPALSEEEELRKLEEDSKAFINVVLQNAPTLSTAASAHSPHNSNLPLSEEERQLEQRQAHILAVLQSARTLAHAS
jgi:hypothetical protein